MSPIATMSEHRSFVAGPAGPAENVARSGTEMKACLFFYFIISRPGWMVGACWWRTSTRCPMGFQQSRRPICPDHQLTEEVELRLGISIILYVPFWNWIVKKRDRIRLPILMDQAKLYILTNNCYYFTKRFPRFVSISK